MITLLLALAASIVNFVFFANTSQALPNAVSVYSVRDIDTYDKGLVNSDAGKNLQALTMEQLYTGSIVGRGAVGDDYDFHGLTEMQAVKFMQGCYGNLDLNANGAGSWGAANSDQLKTALLNFQQESVAPGESVCSCIDHMVSATFDTDKFCYVPVPATDDAFKEMFGYAAAAADGMTQAEYTAWQTGYHCTVDASFADLAGGDSKITQAEWKAEFDTSNADHYAPPADYVDDMSYPSLKYGANAYASGFTDAGTFTTDVLKQYHRDVARLCVESAPPMQTIAFEDVVPAPLYIFIGQCLLVLAAMQIYDSFVTFENKEHGQELHNEERINKDLKKTRGRVARTNLTDTYESYMKERMDVATTWQYSKGILAVIVAVVLVWLSIANYNLLGDQDAKFMTFRVEANRHHRWPVITLFAWITTVIAALVTVFFELTMTRAHEKLADGDDAKSSAVHLWTFHKNGNTAMVLKHIACDVPLIAGFTMLGLGVFAQSDITSVHTLIGCGMIIVVMGFVQHISNVIKGLYNRICARLNAKVVTALTMHNEEIEEDMMKIANPEVKDELMGMDTQMLNRLENTVRPSLQYFGYSRLYFFCIVFLGSLSLLVVAKDTNSVFGLHSMLDGQFLYFVIAFIVCNIGFDFLYELLPFMFESSSTENMRSMIILLYVIFFSLNQILYFWRVPVDK